MKKVFRNLILLPTLLLISCASGNGPQSTYDPWAEDNDDEITLPELPSVPGGSSSSTSTSTSTSTPDAPVETPDEDLTSTHITYLVLGKNGLYKGSKGEAVPDKFLENTIVYHGNAGRDLPGKDKVTSSIEGLQFTSWISYDGGGKPTIYKKVPVQANMILYAFFAKPGEGNVPGGNPDQGGGDAGGEVDPVAKSTIYVNDTTWENVYIHAWKNNGDPMTSWDESPKMTKIEGGFSYELPTKYDRVIFKGEGKNQTKTLEVKHGSDKLCYHIDHQQWGKLDDVLEPLSQTVTYYAQNKWGDWGNELYAHYWNENGDTSIWPGTKMEKEGDRYKITIDRKYTHIKFHDNQGHQTDELNNITLQAGNVYDIKGKEWVGIKTNH